MPVLPRFAFALYSVWTAYSIQNYRQGNIRPRRGYRQEMWLGSSEIMMETIACFVLGNLSSLSLLIAKNLGWHDKMALVRDEITPERNRMRLKENHGQSGLYWS